MCILSWRRALGPLGGLSTGQLNCCLPRMEEKRETRIEFICLLFMYYYIVKGVVSRIHEL